YEEDAVVGCIAGVDGSFHFCYRRQRVHDRILRGAVGAPPLIFERGSRVRSDAALDARVGTGTVGTRSSFLPGACTMRLPSDRTSLTRRDLLRSAAAAGLASSLAPLADAAAKPTPAQRDLIRAENEKAGTTAWLLENTRVDPKTKYRCPWIEGYCSHTSLRAGDALEIMVSTNPPSPFVIDLYRLGYYQGKGGRHLFPLGPFTRQSQPEPERAPA